MSTTAHLPTRTSPRPGRVDVAVVGGGLAGLAAAVTAARAGRSVALVEARDEPGGRARSTEVEGFTVNQGAHALYTAGSGRRVLHALGVRDQGRLPRQRGGAWLRGGERIPFRRGSAIGGTAALGAARRLLSPRSAGSASGLSTAAWLDRHVPDEARALAEMVVRTTSYTADHAAGDAATDLAQVRLGARGVRYLDGGWSSLVDQLLDRAVEAGVAVIHDRVVGVDVGAGGVTVATGAGPELHAGAVVLAAGGAAHADRLLGGASTAVSRWASSAHPVRAACLDVALDRAPRPRWSSTYALDEPLYLVDHAATAALAPPGGAVLHGLFYEPGLRPDLDPRERLEAALDVVQPGWRDHVVRSWYRRDLVVAHDRARAGAAGADRPTARVPDLPRVLVAGDWVGGHGLLADASLGSGREAGEEAARLAAPLLAVG